MTAHKCVNYSGGSNTLNPKTQSRLLKSGMNLTALHIWRRLSNSQPPCPIQDTRVPIVPKVSGVQSSGGNSGGNKGGGGGPHKGGRNSSSIYNYQGKVHILGDATKTLKATTQRMFRLAIMPISRRYMSNRTFEQPHTKGTIFTDTMEVRYKSLDRN